MSTNTLTIQGQHRVWEVQPDQSDTWSFTSTPLTADANPAAALDGEYYPSLQEAVVALMQAEASDNGENFTPHTGANDFSEIPDGTLVFEQAVAPDMNQHNRGLLQVALVLRKRIWKARA